MFAFPGDVPAGRVPVVALGAVVTVGMVVMAVALPEEVARELLRAAVAIGASVPPGGTPPRAPGEADPDLGGVVLDDAVTPGPPGCLPRARDPFPLAGVSPAAPLSRNHAAWPHRQPLPPRRPPGDGPEPTSMLGWQRASSSSPSSRCFCSRWDRPTSR